MKKVQWTNLMATKNQTVTGALLTDTHEAELETGRDFYLWVSDCDLIWPDGLWPGDPTRPDHWVFWNNTSTASASSEGARGSCSLNFSLS